MQKELQFELKQELIIPVCTEDNFSAFYLFQFFLTYCGLEAYRINVEVFLRLQVRGGAARGVSHRTCLA